MAIITDGVEGISAKAGGTKSPVDGAKPYVANLDDPASAGAGSPNGAGSGAANDNRRTARRRTEGQRQTPTIEVANEEEAVKPDASKAEPTKKSHKKKGSTKATAAESAQSAHMLIEMVQLFTTAQFGDKAAFTDFELMVIEPSLGRLLEKYGDIGDKFGGFFDPALVVFGAVIYGNRIGKLASDPVIQRERRKQPDPNVNQQPPQSANASSTPDNPLYQDLFRRAGNPYNSGNPQ